MSADDVAFRRMSAGIEHRYASVPQSLREALRCGDDGARLRALFAQKGYALGLLHLNGCGPEYIVLEEVLSERAPLPMLVLFFKELGGQFRIGAHCVWMHLVTLDAHAFQRSCTPSHARIEQMVETMAHELHMPIRLSETIRFCAHGEVLPLLEMAFEVGAWNALFAFLAAQRRSPLFMAHRLLCSPLAQLREPWLSRRLLPLLPIDALDSGLPVQPVIREALEAERSLRLLEKKRPPEKS